MATVKPFCAFRPKPEFASQVASKPYDVLNSAEARKEAEGNPLSFHHVGKAEIDLPEDIDPYSPAVYQKAKENLHNLIEKKILVRDPSPCFYLYRQIMNGKAQTGIVLGASVDDYFNNVIKKHEHTRAEKEQDRIKLVDTCEANTGPVFLTYRSNNDLKRLIQSWAIGHQADTDFYVQAEGVQHTVWVVNDPRVIKLIEEHFAKMPSLYIADGHHRSAAAAKVGKLRRERNKGYKGDEPFNHFLAVAFPHDELRIMDYNRVVSDLNGMTTDTFISKISSKFTVEKKSGTEPYRPESKREFGMFIDGNWYELYFKGTVDMSDPVKSLDVSILQDNLLNPILNIKDPRTDKRIDFVGGIRGLKELEKRCSRNGDMKIAFAMNPTSVDDLMRIADAGHVMPPKSTWFEPKLKSGLFVKFLRD